MRAVGDRVLSPLRIVVTGVAGAGKTTVGSRLAGVLGAAFLDADDAHPATNIAKMEAGIALTDDDRQPWLLRLRDELAGGERIVVTCSALKRPYRDVLRDAGDVTFVHLSIDIPEAERRLIARRDHFMGASMVASQFEALEPPADDEDDVIVVDATRPADAIVKKIVEAIVDGRDGFSGRDRRGGTGP